MRLNEIKAPSGPINLGELMKDLKKQARKAYITAIMDAIKKVGGSNLKMMHSSKEIGFELTPHKDDALQFQSGSDYIDFQYGDVKCKLYMSYNGHTGKIYVWDDEHDFEVPATNLEKALGILTKKLKKSKDRFDSVKQQILSDDD